MPVMFRSTEEFKGAVGRSFGPTDWLVVEQSRIDQFADATGDHQFIHVDVEKAKQTPFGGTIAHGYFTLALVPHFNAELFALETPGARLNYGVNKVRFPTPVKVGSRIRAHVHVVSLAEVAAGKQLVLRYTMEIEGQQKPACVAETVALLLP